MHRLQALNLQTDVLIVSECVDDDNRQRLKKAGAEVIIRPMRAYPEMLVRGLVAPGSEKIIENLFSSVEDLYLRYEVNITNVCWKDIVCHLIEHDFGTAVAYFNTQINEVDTNPHAHTLITTHCLYVMANDDNPATSIEINKALAEIPVSEKI
ncbi:MAG: hypothetical protein Q9M50_11680 [Methylococcales bacterium]|nr:hypothetical protein [Methylococcales bacterium]